jgi:hypothetical protein
VLTRANWHLTTRKSKIMSQPLCICFSYLTHSTFPQQALEGGIVNRCLQLIERPSLAPSLLSQILWVLLSLFADERYLFSRILHFGLIFHCCGLSQPPILFRRGIYFVFFHSRPCSTRALLSNTNAATAAAPMIVRLLALVLIIYGTEFHVLIVFERGCVRWYSICSMWYSFETRF